MKKIAKPLWVSVVILGSVLLGGCTLGSKTVETIKQESPTTTLTGKILVAGESVTINAGGKVTEVYSRKLDLKKYAGKEVTVTGEFSGTTLFVDTVK